MIAMIAAADAPSSRVQQQVESVREAAALGSLCVCACVAGVARRRESRAGAKGNEDLRRRLAHPFTHPLFSSLFSRIHSLLPFFAVDPRIHDLLP